MRVSIISLNSPFSVIFLFFTLKYPSFSTGNEKSIDFDSPEAMKAFATNEELKAKRVAAGAILESNVVTVMGDESFTS